MQFPLEACFGIRLILNMAKELEKQWEELSKKHHLPAFKELDLDFEASAIEDTNFPLMAVISKMAEKIDFYIGILSDLLQPDLANIYSMHETRAFNEHEKKDIYDLYTKLMPYSRRCLELSLMNNPKEEIEFIIAFQKEWQNIKKELINFLSKMKESWYTESDIKEDLGYLG